MRLLLVVIAHYFGQENVLWRTMSEILNHPMKKEISLTRTRFKASGCAVIKVGSNVLVGKSDGVVNRGVFCSLVASLAKLQNRKDQRVLLVSSGAVAVGRRSAKKEIYKDTQKQALAAIGQPILMHLYSVEFGFYNKRVAQLLLTRNDIKERKRFLHARQTLRQLATFKDVIPIINENDTVASDELQFGDNDQLAALICTLVDAEILLILSDVDGIYTNDPRINSEAKLIKVAYADAEILTSMVKTPKNKNDLTAYGTGGMASKLRAARIAAAIGVPTVIASGRQPNVIERVFAGEEIGTLLLPRDSKLSSRKAWLRFGGVPTGKIFIDLGAVSALKKGASLLSIGITEVKGNFKTGEHVEIIASQTVIAQGLSTYASGEISQIAGHRSSEIYSILGYTFGDAVIHRDDLIIM